ncbi:hypothetical protein L486_03851 [Kwoniella mangroviensis CBS 10435]|uniref:Short-chain dehydrogenase n=1 Tax=Kwoniella mangroviensis CBS 10435 TaxID=1331196 RepID=A0A1B9IV20_9TREE|nr:uncharacterized protein I203_08327 [Kwoniella mangroviensis CBS 8507]OCF59347.1 hypothetical protein L486_03851 [Kwoniella mangroviensis CBS 10435]OCF62587.1 hypothetical protein I203_08327 [Kwoniella mangroviensis CBS 8507]OCF76403.1 hypothetical protein I204_02098 [Kwoniella mangroviensis CBS 8886]
MSATALFKSTGQGGLEVSSLFNVEGWIAVVTGGGTGLGLVTATALAENGAKVYITGRRAEPLLAAVEGYEKLGNKGKGSIVAIQADVSTKEGIKKFAGQIQAKEKWINVLINNHGVSLGATDINACEQTPEGLSKQMFEGETFETWLETYKINTASYHFTTFGFLPLLAAAKTVGGFPEPGNIVNLSSMSGITKTSQRGQFNYNAGKAATISLSHQQATEFARRGLGIRVNVVCPGYFPSGMTIIPPENNTGSEAHYNEFRQQWGIPFGRPGKAVDYAQCIFGLITNQYVTGAEVVIDGGWLLESGKSFLLHVNVISS